MRARVLDVGAYTAVGLSAEQTAFGIRAGLFCPRTIGHRDENGEELGAALVTSIPEEIFGWERMVSLAVPAFRQVIAASRSAGVQTLYLALPSPRPGFGEADARGVCDELASATLDERASVVPVFGGNDAFGRATAVALAHLARDPTTTVFVGGVDTWHSPTTYQHMDSEFRLLSERAPNGFIPGEGAAFARLAGVDAGEKESLATLEFAAAGEENPANELDAVWTDLVEQAGARAGVSPIPWVLVDQRTERHRARSWDRIFYRLRDSIDPQKTLIDTLAERLGDVGAASGAILLTLATVALSAGFAPGPAAVVALGGDSLGRSSFTVVRSKRSEPP